MKSANKQIIAVVKGRVQGVGFRYYTQLQAKNLNLTGEVKNLHDGSVQIVAEGKHNELEQLLEQVRRGPALARVDLINVEWLDASNRYSDFSVAF